MRGPEDHPALWLQRVFDPVNRSLKKLKHVLDKKGEMKVDVLAAKVGYSLAAKSARLNATADSFPEMEFDLYGVLGRSETRGLLVADASEEDPPVRFSKFVWAQIVAGSVLVTMGMALSLAMVSGAPVTKAPAPRAMASAATGLNVEALHSECVTGRASSCEKLIDFGSELHLNAQHLTYYKSRACALGRQSYCK